MIKSLSAENNFVHFTFVEIVHRENCSLCRFVHLQICDFCIWKNICAADLRILCTTHFCTFAHLHICVLHMFGKVFVT